MKLGTIMRCKVIRYENLWDLRHSFPATKRNISDMGLRTRPTCGLYRGKLMYLWSRQAELQAKEAGCCLETQYVQEAHVRCGPWANVPRSEMPLGTFLRKPQEILFVVLVWDTESEPTISFAKIALRLQRETDTDTDKCFLLLVAAFTKHVVFTATFLIFWSSSNRNGPIQHEDTLHEH